MKERQRYLIIAVILLAIVFGSGVEYANYVGFSNGQDSVVSFYPVGDKDSEVNDAGQESKSIADVNMDRARALLSHCRPQYIKDLQKYMQDRNAVAHYTGSAADGGGAGYTSGNTATPLEGLIRIVNRKTALMILDSCRPEYIRELSRRLEK